MWIAHSYSLRRSNPTLGDMKTPTLGYCENSSISKLEIAKLQLNQAISLFLAQKFVCAITLSGASETVLSGLLTAQSQTSIVEDSAIVIDRIREFTGLKPAGGMKNNEMYKNWNSARNKLKHHSKGEDEYFEVNLFDEAYWMIKRALANAKKLDLEIEIADEFENWLTININM
jgi:hypothetical protein